MSQKAVVVHRRRIWNGKELNNVYLHPSYEGGGALCSEDIVRYPLEPNPLFVL